MPIVPNDLLHRPRLIAGLLAATCVAALGAGLFVQHVMGYAPCSLCVVQRLGFIGVLGAAALLAALPGAYVLSVALAATVAAVALGGVAVASYQVWLQAFPPLIAACGRGIAGYVDGWPFQAALVWLLESEGDCAKAVSPLGGVSLAQLGLVAFLLISAAAFRLVWLTARGGRAG